MNIKTSTHKSIRGWQSESIITLSDKHEIHVTTMKRHSGAIATTARRVQVDRGATSFIMFTDFSKCYTSSQGRCTERFVQNQHNNIIGDAEQIRNDCNEWYSK